MIAGNCTIGEDQQLHSMLPNLSTELEQLYMNITSLSSRGTREFFTIVKGNNILKELNIAINAITDDACDIITAEEQLFGYTGHVQQPTDSMPSGHSGELYYILDLNV